jgi:type I restriction enzyme S subunit
MTNLDRMIDELCPNGVKFAALAIVAKISNGKDHKHLADGEYPVYGSGGIMRYAKEYIYDQESVLIPRKGSIGNIFYIDSPFWTVDTIFYTKIDQSKIVPKFLYYFLQTQHIEDLNPAAGVPSLTKTKLDKIHIPLPPLAVQREIVRILDNFTELTAELEEKLTAELTARKKQYEYYRNYLLTFRENSGLLLTDRQTDRQTDRNSLDDSRRDM